MDDFTVLVLPLLVLTPILLVVIIFARMSTLHTRIAVLEKSVKQLQHRLSQEGVEFLRESALGSAPLEGTGRHLEEELVTLETQAASVRAAEALPPEPPPAIPAASAPKRIEWESLVGGKLMNRVGALALIIGIGFFLKYAFDQNWLSETVRVVIGAGIGGTLLASGHRFLRRDMPVFAQGLIGAGIAILYLSVYASFNFYHLVSQPVAFVLMAGVTIITFSEALVTNALAVSLLGWAGGFLTPFLLSTGSANMVGLFSYVALLDAGLVLIIDRKAAWRVLEPLTVGATYLVYMLWHLEYFTSTSVGPALGFVTLFWLLFLLLDMVRVLRDREVADPLAHITAAANTLFYLIALLNILEGEEKIWSTAATLLLAAVSLSMALAGNRRRHALGTAEQRHAVATFLLVVTATWIQFDGLALAMALGIEAALFLYLASSLDLSRIRGLSLTLVAVALVVYLSTLPVLHAHREFAPVLNERMAASIILTAVVLFAARTLERLTSAGYTLVRGFLHVAWSVLPLIPLTLEIFDLFTGGEPEHRFDAPFMVAVMAMSWVAYALFLFRAASGRVTVALHVSLCIVVLSLLVGLPQGIAYSPLVDFRWLVNHRTLMLLVQATGLFLLAYWTHRELPQPWARAVARALQVAGILALIVLCTGETLDYFRKEIASAMSAMPADPALESGIQRLRDQQQLSLSGIWLVCAIGLMVIGLWYRTRLFRIVAIVLAAVTIGKVFLVDLSFLNTLYRIFSFVGLGVILLIVSYLYQHYGDSILSERSDTPEPEKNAR